MIKRIFCSIALLAIINSAKAQLEDTLITHLAKINAFYDSARTLAFDLRFIYKSDTVLSNYIHRENGGTITVDRNRYHYRYDNIECMQSDSLLITVMEPEQIMMVAPSTSIQSGGIIPLRKTIDSLANNEFGGYSYTITKLDSVYIIEFKSNDPETEYQWITLRYDPTSYAMISYQVGFLYDVPEALEGEELVGDELIRPANGDPRLLSMTIYFLDYRLGNIDEDLFDEDRYILAGGNGEWRAAPKYEGYAISKMYN